MKNKDLIDILSSLPPDDEVCVEVYDVKTDKLLDTTYDIGFSQNEFGQLVLEVTTGKLISVKNNALQDLKGFEPGVLVNLHQEPPIGEKIQGLGINPLYLSEDVKRSPHAKILYINELDALIQEDLLPDILQCAAEEDKNTG